ncbi:MAG: CRISPR-associated endoribonuclease Cas6 [Bacteroides sp.]|nr:CRISPR-associated endoribonuclease Cas6 [Bacteroides sp.]
MRFKLTLKVEKKFFGNKLPINYQYEQSAAIYRILSKANEQFSGWLHNNGFRLEHRRFKLFTFSRFIIPQYTIEKENERLVIDSDLIDWYISFLPEKSTEEFIKGVFMSQHFEIGDRISTVRFTIQRVEMLPSPIFLKEMSFRTLSPIVLSTKDDNLKIKYISPTDERAQGNILMGLLRKYEAFNGKPYAGTLDYHFSLLNEPKSTLIKIKANSPEETRVRGYRCSMKVELPEALMKIMYEAGCGEKGSTGFGMIEVIK